jgi:hypothetical protein
VFPIFQTLMTELLRNFQGTEVIIDDILIYSTSKEEHDTRLDSVLHTIYHRGLKLNVTSVNSAKQKSNILDTLSAVSNLVPAE